MGNDLVWVAIEGGVVTKPVLTHTSRGTALCKFGVIAEPSWIKRSKGQAHKMYFTVSAMGKTGETVYPMLRPGEPVRIEGKYNDGIYRDKLTDEPRIGRVIYATRVKIFVFWKHRPTSERTKEMVSKINDMKVDDIEIDLDELPF